MEKSKVRLYNKQLARIYCLQLVYFILSGAGILLNLWHLRNDYLFWAIMVLNAFAMFLFQPWKISSYLNEGYGYQEGLKAVSESVTNNKEAKDV